MPEVRHGACGFGPCTTWLCWLAAGRGGSFGGDADHDYGGGGGALGGAIFGAGGSVKVHNSTFFNNYVTRGVAGGGAIVARQRGVPRPQ
jgi:hypothetical protein